MKISGQLERGRKREGKEKEREGAGEFLDLNVTPTARDHLKMTERGRAL